MNIYWRSFNQLERIIKSSTPKLSGTLLSRKDLYQSTEGGNASFYYSNGQVEKMITKHFGETGQALKEYYLQDGRLSFVVERSYNYNRPIYWDSMAVKDNKDSATFQFDASEIIEDRNYFKDGVLIHQSSNQDCGAPNAPEYVLTEQKRIQEEFKELLNVLK